MRINCLFRIAGVLFVCAVPLTGFAQKFQDPTKEELQMTADPKAPGAPAVFLYREETTDNANHFISEYARIKILTESGKEWATVEVPQSGGPSPIIVGRTIHADGTVVPLTGRAEEILSVKRVRSHARARAFTLPAADVGSIVEYRWTLAMGESTVGGATSDIQAFMNSALAGTIPEWDVQQEIPVRKERFYYNPLGDLEKNVIGNQAITQYNSDGEIASYLIYSAHLPVGSRVQASPKPDYTLEIQDVPAFAHEPAALPEEGRRYAVSFYYTPYLAADVYWADEGKRWSKQIDHAAEPTADLKAAAAQIVAGAASDDEKASRLYDAVQGLTNTGFGASLSEQEQFEIKRRRTVRDAQQVWSGKSGTPNELATLYLALARAAGLQARPMAIADRSIRVFDPGYLSLNQLTTTLVVLQLGGNDVYVDPGEKLLPYGQLKWSHTLCGGLLETVDGVSHNAATPENSTKNAITAHTADLVVDGQGNATGTVKVIMNGPEALRWRQLSLTAGKDEAKGRIGALLQQLLPQGMTMEILNVQGLDTAAGFASLTAKVSGPLGIVSGKRLTLPGFVFSRGLHPAFVAQEQRESTIDLHFAEQVIDDVVYHLPAGYSVESAPQPAQMPWPDHAVLVVKTQTGAGTIDIKHIFARGFVLLDPKEYLALRDYYQKIAASDQQQVVLAASN